LFTFVPVPGDTTGSQFYLLSEYMYNTYYGYGYLCVYSSPLYVHYCTSGAIWIVTALVPLTSTPTSSPTYEPTEEPTNTPTTESPTEFPYAPTETPTEVPTEAPTSGPSVIIPSSSAIQYAIPHTSKWIYQPFSF
jgi:hypothetical protein